MTKSRYLITSCFLLITLHHLGCAVAPITRFQTAQTLAPGDVKIGTGFSAARDVSSSFLIPGESHFNYQDNTIPLLEFFGRIGIIPRWDIGIRVFGPFLGALQIVPGGISIDNKIQLHIDEGDFPDFAIAPAVGYSGQDSEGTVFGIREERDYRLVFFDIPGILSRKVSEVVTVYGGAMYSHYVFDGEEQYNGVRRYKVEGGTAALTGFVGVSIHISTFEILPEITITTVTKKARENVKAYPYPGIAFAFNF